MSKKLEKFPINGDAPRNKYDWDKWTNGEIHELISSKWSSTYDFDVPVESMRAMVYRRASNMGLHVRTCKTPKGLAVEFQPLIEAIGPDPLDPPPRITAPDPRSNW